jgi:hypothetical protein
LTLEIKQEVKSVVKLKAVFSQKKKKKTEGCLICSLLTAAVDFLAKKNKNKNKTAAVYRLEQCMEDVA